MRNWRQMVGGRISIHAPLTGSDQALTLQDIENVEFQSTLPLRGATTRQACLQRSKLNFNPRSPYGERLLRIRLAQEKTHFNPRSPYGERHLMRICQEGFSKFQSTLPLRGATSNRPKIPIQPPNFNPRSPYGERPTPPRPERMLKIFQSTLPLRGATRMWDHKNSQSGFQSTLPLRGATL